MEEKRRRRGVSDSAVPGTYQRSELIPLQLTVKFRSSDKCVRVSVRERDVMCEHKCLCVGVCARAIVLKLPESCHATSASAY